MIKIFNQHPTLKDQQQKQSFLNIPSFEIKNDFFEIELTPEVYEVDDMNRTIEQNFSDYRFEFEYEADTISMKSVLKTSNLITFNSDLIKVLGLKTQTTLQDLINQKN